MARSLQETKRIVTAKPAPQCRSCGGLLRLNQRRRIEVSSEDLGRNYGYRDGYSYDEYEYQCNSCYRSFWTEDDLFWKTTYVTYDLPRSHFPLILRVVAVLVGIALIMWLSMRGSPDSRDAPTTISRHSQRARHLRRYVATFHDVVHSIADRMNCLEQRSEQPAAIRIG